MTNKERKRPDDDEGLEGRGTRNKADEFKIFEPKSKKFVNETTWAQIRSSTKSTALEPGAGLRKDVVPDPLSKFPPFHFVNLQGGPRQGNPNSRSAARAHVMRRVCRDRDEDRIRARGVHGHLAQHSFGKKSSLTSGSEFPGSTEHLPLRRGVEGFQAAATAILVLDNERRPDIETVTEIGSHGPLLDSALPRGSYSIPNLSRPVLGPTRTADMEQINYFIQVFAKSLLPMSAQDEKLWFWMALADEACYHSTLFVSRAHQALVSGRSTSTVLDLESHRHQGQAIREINKRLSKSTAARDDGAAAAIACLAAYENLNGSRDIAATHIQALETIRNIRGGFHSTGMAGFLEQLVHWVELSNASADRRKSKFVPPDLLSRNTYQLASASSTIFSEAWISQWGALAPTTVTVRTYRGMRPAGTAIFHRLRQLAHIRAKVKSVRHLDAGSLYRFTQNVSILERHINTIVNWPSANESPQPETCMPLYSSTLAFIYIVFRDVPVSSPILERFVVRLKMVLDDVGLENFCQKLSPSFLLWMLFLGSWIAEDRQDWPWYSNSLVWLIRRSGLRTWEQVKPILAEYCLVESVCEHPWRELWAGLQERVRGSDQL